MSMNDVCWELFYTISKLTMDLDSKYYVTEEDPDSCVFLHIMIYVNLTL